LPVWASQSFAVVSRLLVRMVLLSGLNATLETRAVCPVSVKSSFFLTVTEFGEGGVV
jgi:hypothetical protein